MGSIADNITRVQGQIKEASARAGRGAEEVHLLGASKTRTPEEIYEAVEAGLLLFGENRVQEAKQKIPLCSSRAEWHFIGHLQSNKVRDAVALFSCIQSIDSVSLAETVSQEAEKQGRTMDILVEVNVSGEKSKFGMKPEELLFALEKVNVLPRLRICGLMTLAPWEEKPQEAKPYFARLREWRDRAEKELGIKLPELSMGMSHDFLEAIQEGSTLVRVGTSIFGQRKKSKP
ncbi:MAG: YggS family pyridoxal phosphate-dependent enzyme [Verrucomicrobiae bacterium]|nr:YggS family pyridoxal phosphate-dependent enzyme [Verrucomicrobiae bacterium]